jgi:lysophospholipase L1-like esterase
VVVAPAPDLSVLPWIPAQVRVFVQAGSAALRQAQARAALSEGARVATIEGSLATGFATDPTLFSADRFHPSSDGYAVIAAALSPAIRAAAAEVLDRAG